MKSDEIEIIFTNVPKLAIEVNSYIAKLHLLLQIEYIKVGMTPLEGTLALQELFNGNPQRLMREFGVKINYPLYLHNLLLSNLHENIKLGFTEQYGKELFMEIKEKVK